MAFRFRREGDLIKHRMHLERTGMQPWIEDFKWRVVDWHYQFYMGPKARSAILSQHKVAPKLQEVFDKRSHGFVTRMQRNQAEGAKYSHDHTRFFAWTTFTPQITPYRKNSNPFCPVTPNKTGWREYVEISNPRGAVRAKAPNERQHRVKLIPDPRPRGPKTQIAGTDDSVPIFPNFS
mmetsp:Transcript_66866/g.160073  ORF Transcript_66866/g.160073 Transcript_66866/m.160073 type:complete len:178 (-) Transcript_66866:20-553(-)